VLAPLTTAVWGLGTLTSNYKGPTNGVLPRSPYFNQCIDRLHQVLPKGWISPPKWAWLWSRDRLWGDSLFKYLSCRRETARVLKSVEILSAAAQLYEKSHL